MQTRQNRETPPRARDCPLGVAGRLPGLTEFRFTANEPELTHADEIGWHVPETVLQNRGLPSAIGAVAAGTHAKAACLRDRLDREVGGTDPAHIVQRRCRASAPEDRRHE